MLNQGKVSRGVSYSPKVSASGKPTGPQDKIGHVDNSSKWSRVRNALLHKADSLNLEESMSMPSSPVRNLNTFFVDDIIEPGGSKPLEKDSSAGSRSSGDWIGVQSEIQHSYYQLQRQLSQEFQQ